MSQQFRIRELLRPMLGLRNQFEARVGDFEDKYNRFSEKRERWMVFLDLKSSTGRPLSDHVWFRNCQAWEKAGLKKGDHVRFTATVVKYKKRKRVDWMEEAVILEDYKLAYPTNVKKLAPDGVHVAEDFFLQTAIDSPSFQESSR
jgi:hypothetical protein